MLFSQPRFFSPFPTPLFSNNSLCLNPHISSSIIRLFDLIYSPCFTSPRALLSSLHPPAPPSPWLDPDESQQEPGACSGSSGRTVVTEDEWLSPAALQDAHTVIPHLWDSGQQRKNFEELHSESLKCSYRACVNQIFKKIFWKAHLLPKFHMDFSGRNEQCSSDARTALLHRLQLPPLKQLGWSSS